MMRPSKFDKINAALDRAEFALGQLQKKVDETRRKRASARTPDAIVALDLEAAELLQQLRKISDAVHTGSPAPHLRLVSDKA
jgi:phage shock protein A